MVKVHPNCTSIRIYPSDMILIDQLLKQQAEKVRQKLLEEAGFVEVKLSRPLFIHYLLERYRKDITGVS